MFGIWLLLIPIILYSYYELVNVHVTRIILELTNNRSSKWNILINNTMVLFSVIFFQAETRISDQMLIRERFKKERRIWTKRGCGLQKEETQDCTIRLISSSKDFRVSRVFFFRILVCIYICSASAHLLCRFV